MAEEVTKVIENVDELFPEIIVNGESHVSERYVEPPQADIPASTQQTQEEEPTYPQQTVQGEYVDTLELNGVEHDLKDSPLSAEVRALQELLSTIQSRLNELNALIPSTATAQNQLADKNFVNSSIATNTANFLGTYTSLADIEAIQNPTNNDYAFLETADGAGNNVYDRYKYSAEDGEWLFEYELNNSSFTAEQWATINSGITQVSDTVQDGDTDPVSSDAVYEALQNVAGAVDVVEDDNMNPVTSNAVANKISSLDVNSVGGSGKYISAIEEVDGKINATASNLATTVQSGNNQPVTSDAVYNNFLDKYRQKKNLTPSNATAIIQALTDRSLFCCYLITISRDSAEDTAIGVIYWVYGRGFDIKWIIPPTTSRYTVTITQDSLNKATIDVTANYERCLSILDLNGSGILTLS